VREKLKEEKEKFKACTYKVVSRSRNDISTLLGLRVEPKDIKDYQHSGFGILVAGNICGSIPVNTIFNFVRTVGDLHVFRPPISE
jgi:hypothetical protein